jgi:hypothetical protein
MSLANANNSHYIAVLSSTNLNCRVRTDFHPTAALPRAPAATVDTGCLR